MLPDLFRMWHRVPAKLHNRYTAHRVDARSIIREVGGTVARVRVAARRHDARHDWRVVAASSRMEGPPDGASRVVQSRAAARLRTTGRSCRSTPAVQAPQGSADGRASRCVALGSRRAMASGAMTAYDALARSSRSSARSSAKLSSRSHAASSCSRCCSAGSRRNRKYACMRRRARPSRS
jgi:hypothetical protein